MNVDFSSRGQLCNILLNFTQNLDLKFVDGKISALH